MKPTRNPLIECESKDRGGALRLHLHQVYCRQQEKVMVELKC